MTKEQLLHELKHDIWVMMKPSPVHGNGVFALRDIPKGKRGLFSKNIGEWIKVERSEIDNLPQHSKELVETYCLFDEDYYYVPDYGFKVMDIVIFLNHSETPNIVSTNDGEDFETLREIKSGEELFIDYGEIVDSDE
ncbi:MAG: SET domain-containing protein [Lacibacter sp.]